MQTFCKGRLVSPKAICSSPVGLTRVLFKALFEFFSSAHVHSKLNLLVWGGGEKKQRRKIWSLQAILPSIQLFIWTVSLDTILICHGPSDTCCCIFIPKGFLQCSTRRLHRETANNETLTSPLSSWDITFYTRSKRAGRMFCGASPAPSQAIQECLWKMLRGIPSQSCKNCPQIVARERCKALGKTAFHFSTLMRGLKNVGQIHEEKR